MDATTLNTAELTRTAIDALKKAYNEAANTQSRQFISSAYTAVTLLKFAIGISDEHNEDADGDCDPSEYCAAI